MLDAPAGFAARDLACAHGDRRRATRTADRGGTAVVAEEHLAIGGAAFERAWFGFGRTTCRSRHHAQWLRSWCVVLRRRLVRGRGLDHDFALDLTGHAGMVLEGDRAVFIDTAKHRLRVQGRRGKQCKQQQRCGCADGRVHGRHCHWERVAVSAELDGVAMVGSRVLV